MSKNNLLPREQNNLYKSPSSSKGLAESMKYLKDKSLWVRKETLKIHKSAQGTRIASCLSDIEIFTVLYYGKILDFNPKEPYWEQRDRFIVSKAHGGVSLYPILSDLGFFDKKQLKRVCKDGYSFGSIPDCSVPGFESINGSLGHGLGFGCGIAIALKKKDLESKVFVLSGDAELFEGSVWEAIMFAGHHRLDNLVLIVDNNKRGMLGYCRDVINLEPLNKKFEIFNWDTKIVDGHNVKELYHTLKEFKCKGNKPKVLIANTKKGKGVPELEEDELCHIKSLDGKKIDRIIRELK